MGSKVNDSWSIGLGHYALKGPSNYTRVSLFYFSFFFLIFLLFFFSFWLGHISNPHLKMCLITQQVNNSHGEFNFNLGGPETRCIDEIYCVCESSKKNGFLIKEGRDC